MKFAAAVVVSCALSIHCYSSFVKMMQARSQKRKAAALVITILGLPQIVCAGYEFFSACNEMK